MSETALENQYADELREARMAQNFNSGDAGASWREIKTAALKERAKDKFKEKVMAPAKTGTSQLLRFWWETLIPSFGLSLIGINIHIFLRFVLGDNFFCKLGEEWIPKEIKSAGGEAGKTAGKAIGIAEVMAVLLLDIIAFVVILSAISLVAMVATWINAGAWDKVKIIWGAGWEGIRVLVELFF